MTAPEARLRFESVSLAYPREGGRVQAVEDLQLAVEDREFVCLLGPSGCGKTSILHMAAGFLKPSSGRVLAGGRRVEGPGVDRGMVFQQHRLFPWLTVAGNVEFGPRLRGLPRDRRAEVSRRYLQDVGLAEFTDCYPRQLSVGMQQRVALARAFANDPETLLMDEPFASVDALTRLQMQELLLSLWETRSKTVLFVTHDVDEALFLADRICVLSARPARVVLELAVDLPRPRGAASTETRRVGLRGEILARLRPSTAAPSDGLAFPP
ncbi:MAG: ABC transporter ATP-binding protein [Elusimicrobia bacterium]|nr:ABC transporter ATP-binding protein [Elusimicrobiota bacterium]